MFSSLRRFLACVCHWGSEGSLVADDPAHPYNQCKSFVVHWHHLSSPNDFWLIRCDVGQVVVTIDDLPDDVLLAIFDFYVVKYQRPEFLDFGTKMVIESWQSLVHVCRRWRVLVFASPRRLGLRLCCKPATSARMSSDVWPPLPLLIDGSVSETSADNVLAELEHSDRICQIQIDLDRYTTPEIEKLWAAMQVPFPELADLHLAYEDYEDLSRVPVLPDSFVGGSAPCLRDLFLVSIPFPGIPKLLLSATHLVDLGLLNIPHSGYFSPEAIATCLSALASLKLLRLGFESPESCPDLEGQRPFLPTRFVLSTLTTFLFKGVHEYLEEFVARIDAPQIHWLSITFFNDIDFDTPELIQFISRTPGLGVYDEARLIFDRRDALVRLRPRPGSSRMVDVKIICQVSGWQLSSLAQICALSLRLLLTMKNLYISEHSKPQLDWEDDIEDTEWLDLLQPFTAVKNLCLSKQFAPRIAPALQELTGARTTEVLPALQNIFLEGFRSSEPVQEGIAQFISARQLTNRPVVISAWDRVLVRDETEDSEVDD
jgi:hypothetical protein